MAGNALESRPVTFERERGVYRVDQARNLAHVSVEVGYDSEKTARIQRILSALAQERIPIFLIKLHADSVSFGVEGARLETVERCLNGAAIAGTVRRNLALVTVWATSMSDLTGVMVRIADSLQNAGARLIGVGDSHNSVQLLIDGEHADSAVAELESTFELTLQYG